MYRRKRSPRKRKQNMTVCIAAICKTNVLSDGIVLVTDWQLTTEDTGLTTKTGFKQVTVQHHVCALGSGDMILFHDLIERTKRKIAAAQLNRQATTSEVADYFLEAEWDWKQEYLERHVLSSFGLTWQTLFSKMAENALPESYIKSLRAEVNAISFPYDTEAIFAGLEMEPRFGTEFVTAKIYKVTASAKEDYSPQGYAIIGDGEDIADNELTVGQYSKFMSQYRTAVLCYFAKKRAEVLYSVGEDTGLWVLDHESGDKMIYPNITVRLESAYQELKSLREQIDSEAYEKAAKIFEEAAIEDKQRQAERKNPFFPRSGKS